MDNNETRRLKWVEYYNFNVTQFEEEIQQIAESTNINLRKVFCINMDDPRMSTAVFLKTFETFVGKLKKLSQQYSNFEINIANRLAIGFNNVDSDDDEKSGNFVFYLRHLKSETKTEPNSDPTVSNIERCVQWNAENIIHNPEIIRDTVVEAGKALHDIDIQLGNTEIIMPIFIMYYEAIISFMKIRRRELNEFEYMIEFPFFRIYCRESEDARDVIMISPTVIGKVTMKDDVAASANAE